MIELKYCQKFGYGGQNPNEVALETPEAMANESSNHSASGKSANDYFKDGEKKFRSKDYQGAIDSYSKAIEFNQPEQEWSFFYRGYCKNKLGDFQSSIDDYSKVLEIDTEKFRHGQVMASYIQSVMDQVSSLQKCNRKRVIMVV